MSKWPCEKSGDQSGGGNSSMCEWWSWKFGGCVEGEAGDRAAWLGVEDLGCCKLLRRGMP